MFIELLLITTILVVFIAYQIRKQTQKLCEYFDERKLKYKSASENWKSFLSILFGKQDAFETGRGFYDAFPDETYVNYKNT